MAIVRSHGSHRQQGVLASPESERAREAVEARIAAAFAEGRAQAQREMKDERQRCEQRVAEAQREAEAARRAIEDRWEPALRGLERLQERASVVERDVLQASEGELVRLALAIAGRVLHRELEVDPAWMRSLIGAVLDGLPDRLAMTLLMHPLDAKAVRDRAEELGLGSTISVVDDPQLARGALVVRSGGTEREAGIPDSWERLRRYLEDLAPRSLGEGVATAVDDVPGAGPLSGTDQSPSPAEPAEEES